MVGTKSQTDVPHATSQRTAKFMGTEARGNPPISVLPMALVSPLGQYGKMRFIPILALALSGCAGGQLPQDTRPDVPVAALTASCCSDLETFPKWMVSVAESAPSIAPWLGTVNFREGFLTDKTEAWALVTPALRPLDILLFHSDGRLSSRLIPGHFSHGALYLGNEDQLRANGLWYAPWFAPHRAAIREGRYILDSVTGGVRLTTIEELSDADAVGVLRPNIGARGPSGKVHKHVLEALGIPFDFDFDSGDDSRLFCIELIDTAMPELNLPEIEAYGRLTIVPDAVAAIAFEDNAPLSFVGYLRGSPRGWRTGSSRLMALDMRDAWSDS